MFMQIVDLLYIHKLTKTIKIKEIRRSGKICQLDNCILILNSTSSYTFKLKFHSLCNDGKSRTYM